MIFPGDFQDFYRKPELKLSWVILVLNIFVFGIVNIFFDSWPTYEIRKKILDQNLINSVYEMYMQTLDPVEKTGLKGGVFTVYASALKDQKFWSRVGDFPFKGDFVQIEETRKIIIGFYKDYLKSPHYYFGLGALEISPWSWVTYQFVHVSLMHLLGNLILIFLIVSYLEKSVPATWIAATYLFSGFAGGISFLYFDSLSGISVIGASASASGLMSFLLVNQLNRVMPWGYLIAPVRGGFGKIYLPVFFIFPIFLLSDLLSILSEPTGIVSNIAVSAHVGGFFMGLIMGLYYLLFLRSESASHRIFGDDYGLNKLS